MAGTALALNHPASSQDNQDRAAQLLVELTAQRPGQTLTSVAAVGGPGKSWRSSSPSCCEMLKATMRTIAVIPALNEAAGLAGVLAEMPPGWISEIIVVDGGSRDATPDVARQAGARVVVEPRSGYGRALASGIAAAAEPDVFVFLDADGSDDPGDLARLLGPIRRGRADIVLGSRLAGGRLPAGMPPQQRFGNRLAGWLIRALYRVPLTDLSPMRAIRAEVLHALQMREMTYGWPTEMIVKAIRGGYRLLEIPVGYRPRLHGRSKISGTFRGTVLAAYCILGTTFRYAWPRQAR
jgi:glycosyltransferase involved in cell wall biosynthesis